MFKFQLLFLWILFQFALGLKAQSGVDSLLQLLPQTQGDTAKARLYKTIADELADQPNRALLYANRGLRWVQKMQWPKGIGVFNGIIGRIYIDQGNYEQAARYLKAELKIHQQNRDSFNIASAHNALGNLYGRQGQYSPALDAYLRALRIAEPAKASTLLPIILGNISIVYSNQNHFDKAFAYQRKALALHQQTKDSLGIAASYSSLANLYQLKKDTAQALTYYEKSIHLYRNKSLPIELAKAYQNQALLYRSTQRKLDRQLQAQAIWNQSFPAHQLSITNLGNIAWVYLDIAERNLSQKSYALRQATYFYQRAAALADSVKDEGNQHFLLSLKAVLEAAKGNYDLAYPALYRYHKQYDSIYSQESKNQLAEAESNYYLEKKNAEIAIQQLTISHQRKVQWAFALGSLLLLLIAFLFYRVSQVRRKSNQQLQQLNQSLDQANRQKAQLLAVISHDLRHPLSNLIGLLHLQKNAPELLNPAMAAQNQARITTNTEVLLENMENMLLWSKEQMNQASIQLAPVYVASLFQRLEQTFAQQAEISWSFECTPDLIIQTDSNYLWVILQNLCANAQKALYGHTNPQIQCLAWQEGTQVYLQIQDNGPGFPSTILDKQQHLQVADLFFNGFGLQVVHDFAQKLGIKLRFENLAGGGASVKLSL
jgi:signal transduction histidine kinase